MLKSRTLFNFVQFCSINCSHSVPKALSALAASESDEEDQESTPVITNGEAKPTAPMPNSDSSDANNGKKIGNSTPFSQIADDTTSHAEPLTTSVCGGVSKLAPTFAHALMQFASSCANINWP